MSIEFRAERGGRMQVAIKERVFTLKEIQWKEGATYVLEANEQMTAWDAEDVQRQLSEFIKANSIKGVKFLILNAQIKMRDVSVGYEMEGKDNGQTGNL